MSPRPGVLLANVGTPDSPAIGDVRRYLAEFLMDPRVIDTPAVARWLLVHGFILRTRPRRSAASYRQIWTEHGSPLSVHGRELVDGLRTALRDEVAGIELGMRYGRPGLGQALHALFERGIDDVLVVPLYPQYSHAAWASAFDAVCRAAARLPGVPRLRFMPPFHAEPAFLDAVAEVARPFLDGLAADRVLFSFHGLPASHIRKSDVSGQHCLAAAACCDRIAAANRFCYRAQCFATARGVASRLGLGANAYEIAFQSRLTRHWIRPFTDERIRALPGEGVRRLLVICPSFVADCLETLEEIGLRAAASFRAAGGEALVAVPCVNGAPVWIEGLAGLVRAQLTEAEAQLARARFGAAGRARLPPRSRVP